VEDVLDTAAAEDPGEVPFAAALAAAAVVGDLDGDDVPGADEAAVEHQLRREFRRRSGGGELRDRYGEVARCHVDGRARDEAQKRTGGVVADAAPAVDALHATDVSASVNAGRGRGVTWVAPWRDAASSFSCATAHS